MDIINAYRKFVSFGSWRLLREYGRMGVITTLFAEAAYCMVHGRSFKNLYAVIHAQVTPYLIQRYQHFVPNEIPAEDIPSSSAPKPKTIWFCWLQGLPLDSSGLPMGAPELVLRCYQSIQNYLPDYKVVIIDADNYRQYITLPDYIETKWKKGIIPPALFSDILRLELLIRYGGTWMDATVLMTDPDRLSDRDWLRGILEADLFFFQYYDRHQQFSGIGNWFISAQAEQWVLCTIREILYSYWRDYDCVLYYYIFHLAFDMVVHRHPSAVGLMPKRSARPSLYLRDRISTDYDEQWYNELTKHVCFHKLNYRKPYRLEWLNPPLAK